MRIVWSPHARDDLLAVHGHVAADNPDAARTLHNKIISRVMLLLEAPHIGRPGRVAGTRELVVPGTPYIVPYKVKEGTLQILRVYHAARCWPESLE